MTPGQQMAELAMVTAKDLRDARGAADELGIMVDAPAMMLAMAVKAKQLAKAIGCETKEAWLLLQKERAELLPYIHQRRPQAADAGPDTRPVAYLVPEGESTPLADFTDQDGDDIEFIDQSPAAAPQVGRPKSDD